MLIKQGQWFSFRLALFSQGRQSQPSQTETSNIKQDEQESMGWSELDIDESAGHEDSFVSENEYRMEKKQKMKEYTQKQESGF